MAFFVQLREKIRHFVARREKRVLRLWYFLLSLAAMLTINEAFGYQDALNHWWVAVIIALICSFLPPQGTTVILLFVILLHFMALSTNLAVTTLVLIFVCYGVCGYFRSESTYHLIAIPILHQLQIPYAIPMGTALMRNINEIAVVICGSFLSCFLKTVRDNASMFLDPTSQITALDLMQSQMLSRPLFYFFLAAMVAMFLVVYGIRNRNLEYAWLIAVLAGCLTEFVILLTGYLFTGNYSGVPSLIIGNVITFLAGCVVNYIFLNLDYSRTEQVQFEDDEYYYYVTAVPKLHITEEEKEIKTITREPLDEKERRRRFRWNRKRSRK